MKLSVIIPCYNGAETIGAQLEALAGQRWQQPWEVIVADNGSTDDSIKIVGSYKRRISNLRIVDASARRGQPYALNVGVAAAKGEAIALCDADDVVGAGWVAAMGKALSECDGVAGRIDTEKLNPPWIFRAFPHPQRDGLQKVGYPPYLPYGGGCTRGFRRYIPQSIGGFDEGFRYLHDIDFCFRLQQAGYTLHFVKDAVVNYRLRSSLSGLFIQARDYTGYEIKLQKKYQALAGMPVTLFSEPWRWSLLLRQWGYLCWRLLCLREKQDLARLAAALGRLVGYLHGTFVHRFVPIVL